MDPVQQEINKHKSKLLNLINNLNNTQSIDDEISINNDIKTESECLKSLLNIKQTNLMNQMNQINQNNNFDANPFMIQPNNLFINQQQQMMQQQMMDQQQMMQRRMMQIQQSEAAKQAQMQNILNNQGQGMGNQDTSQGQAQGFGVIFRVSGATGQVVASIRIQCTPYDKVSDIIEKYRNEAYDRDNTKKFIFNAKYLNTSLSVAEAGITNDANIFVVATKGIKGVFENTN